MPTPKLYEAVYLPELPEKEGVYIVCLKDVTMHTNMEFSKIPLCEDDWNENVSYWLRERPDIAQENERLKAALIRIKNIAESTVVQDVETRTIISIAKEATSQTHTP